MVIITLPLLLSIKRTKEFLVFGTSPTNANLCEYHISPAVALQQALVRSKHIFHDVSRVEEEVKGIEDNLGNCNKMKYEPRSI